MVDAAPGGGEGERGGAALGRASEHRVHPLYLHLANVCLTGESHAASLIDADGAAVGEVLAAQVLAAR